jgi:hypothetical protein
VHDGRLDHLPVRFDLEGHLRPTLVGHFGIELITDPHGLGELRRKGVPGVGQPVTGLGFEDDPVGIGDRHTILLPGHRRPHRPIRLEGDAPVSPGEGGIGQRLPESFRCGVDVGRVDEPGVANGFSLQSCLQVGERAHPLAVVPVDPALGDGVDRRGVEVVQLLPATPERGHQAARLQYRQMLADGLPRHLQPGTQLPQALPVARVQAVEQPAAAGIGERLEHRVHLTSSLNMQPSGCMNNRRPVGCRSGPLTGGSGCAREAGFDGNLTSRLRPDGRARDTRVCLGTEHFRGRVPAQRLPAAREVRNLP